MFIRRDARAAVSDEKGNVMYIKEKMDVKTKGRVTDSLAAISDLDLGGKGGGGKAEISLNLGSQNCVLLVNNIVAWEGPDFLDDGGVKIPCTRENIERLDPDDPLVELVLGEINQRNLRPESPDPNSPTGDGSMSGGG